MDKFETMKNNKIALFIVFIAAMSFGSCKKGENDPFISLRSRDARVTGKWELTKWEYKLSEPFWYDESEMHYEKKSFNGSSLTISYNYMDYFNNLAKDSTYTVSYSRDLEIDKGGRYKQVVKQDTTSSALEYYWYWYDGNKNKVGIFVGEDLYYIDQLKNNEMVLAREWSSIDEDGTTTETEELTFEKK